MRCCWNLISSLFSYVAKSFISMYYADYFRELANLNFLWWHASHIYYFFTVNVHATNETVIIRLLLISFCRTFSINHCSVMERLIILHHPQILSLWLQDFLWFFIFCWSCLVFRYFVYVQHCSLWLASNCLQVVDAFLCSDLAWSAHVTMAVAWLAYQMRSQ